jgi:hypothetical protein
MAQSDGMKLSPSEAHRLAGLLVTVARPTTPQQQVEVAAWVERLYGTR